MRRARRRSTRHGVALGGEGPLRGDSVASFSGARRGEWCGRGDSNPHEHSLNGFSYRLRLSPPRRCALKRVGRFAVWTIPSPCPDLFSGFRCCPSSLYTFPARMLPPGLARDCHHRFPRIWAVLHHRFPDEHSSFTQVRCVCHSATPAWILSTAGSYGHQEAFAKAG